VVHERSGRWVQSAAGGDDHYSGDLMETFTWAGAVAAVTERIGIVSTVPHFRSPVVGAKKFRLQRRELQT
jgi:alkanesulfonate monooxygenase SsuD/methylene tetrahydromethanopterin reductase-like flavin-dependent oxidoreductase (luciferase family)